MLHSEIHLHVCTKAMPPTGCTQPVVEQDRDSGWSIPMRHRVPLMSSFGSRTTQRRYLRWFHPRFLPSSSFTLGQTCIAIWWLLWLPLAPSTFLLPGGRKSFQLLVPISGWNPTSTGLPQLLGILEPREQGKKKDGQPLVIHGKAWHNRCSGPHIKRGPSSSKFSSINLYHWSYWVSQTFSEMYQPLQLAPEEL